MAVTPTQTLNRARGEQLCEGGLKIEGQLETTAAATIGGGLTTSAGISSGGDLIFPGGGLIRGGLPGETAPDSNTTISRNTITVCVPVGSSPYAWTIFGTGQHDGDWVKVYCNSLGTCTLKDPAGNTLLLLNGSGIAVHAMAVRISGTWYICEQGNA